MPLLFQTTRMVQTQQNLQWNSNQPSLRSCRTNGKREWLVVPATTVADRLDKAKVGEHTVLLFRKLRGTPLRSGGASSAGRRKVFRMHRAISSAWCNQIM